MQKTWLRRLLKVLLVYFIACAPEMWKLAMLHVADDGGRHD